VKYGLIIINIFCMAALVVSGIACYVNPAQHTLVALIGLGFPVLLILNILFTGVWIVFRKKFFILPLALVLIFTLRFTDFSAENDKTTYNAKSFRIMSYNAHGLGYTYWPKHKEQFAETADFLHSQNLDIVCIQEYSNGYRDFPTEKKLQKEFGNSHISYFQSKWMRGDVCSGIATFSRFPIVGKKNVSATGNGNNIILLTDVVIDKDTVRIINCHLQSNRFSEGEYEFIESMNSFNADVYKNSKIDNNLQGLRNVLARMNKAYKLRVEQADTLVKLIRQSPYKTIVCGDFNDTQSSYIYRKVSRNMHDSYRIAGRGWQNTYRRFWPGIRIDYILYNNSFICTNYNVPAYDASDHRPVVGEYAIVK